MSAKGCERGTIGATTMPGGIPAFRDPSPHSHPCGKSVRPTWKLLAAVAFLFGVAACSGQRDTHERLHGVLWMQTSAEYRVLSTRAYVEARLALDSALEDASWTAALEQKGDFQALRPAVIMDLDETVLDNTPFEARLIKDRSPFSREAWDRWVENGEAPAVPGAVEFISHARKKGVSVFFVTNRRAQHEPQTRRNLEKLGIKLPTDLDTVLSEREPPYDWPYDKGSRRAFLAKDYRILLLVGDDLGDFLSGAEDNPEKRVALAQEHGQRWGRSWFLIPNPIYGSWEATLYPKGLSDEEILMRKRSWLREWDGR